MTANSESINTAYEWVIAAAAASTWEVQGQTLQMAVPGRPRTLAFSMRCGWSLAGLATAVCLGPLTPISPGNISASSTASSPWTSSTNTCMQDQVYLTVVWTVCAYCTKARKHHTPACFAHDLGSGC